MNRSDNKKVMAYVFICCETLHDEIGMESGQPDHRPDTEETHQDFQHSENKNTAS